jgi:hypothetical protein
VKRILVGPSLPLRDRPARLVEASWALLAALSWCLGVSACASGARDVVPDTPAHTVPGDGPGAKTKEPAPDAYVHIARRPHVQVGLAEARGMTEPAGAEMAEVLASRFEACAERLARQGALTDGAARLVVVAGPRGEAEGFNLTLAPGEGVDRVATLCLVAPAKMMVFPATGAKQRGVAVELTWTGRPKGDGGA